MHQITSVAFDWTTLNLYWADGQHKIIAAKPFAKSTPMWLSVVSDLKSPQDIAVDPIRQ